MIEWRCLALLCAAVCLCGSSVPARADIVDNFTLLDADGFTHELYRSPAGRAVLLVRVDGTPEDAGTLEQIHRQFAYHDIRCYGIMLTSGAGLPEKLPILPRPAPVLADTGGVVSSRLHLDRPGDVLLVEAQTWRSLSRVAAGAQWLEPVQRLLEDFVSGKPLLEPVIPDWQSVTPAPDYASEIVPILEKRCLACHAEGGAAPLPFSSHDKIAGRAAMVREVLLTKRMPPWFADPRMGEFENDRGLPIEEEKVLLRWLDAGCPKASGDDPLAGREEPPAGPWPQGAPDMVLTLPEEQSVPAQGLLDYRHIEIPLNLDQDVWVQGVHVKPSNPKVVHHVLMFLKEPGKTVDLRGEFFASFLPGSDPDIFPEGTGKLLPRHATVLLQLHYTPTGKEEKDRTEVGIYLCKEKPPRILRTASAYSRDFVIPPGVAAFPVKASYTFEREATLYALRPHMHYRGRRITYEALYPDGRLEPLLSVPAYNFYWQTTYRLSEPKLVPAGTMILCNGLFDNSASNPLNPNPDAQVTWGDHSTDEMFVGDVRFAYTAESPEAD